MHHVHALLVDCRLEPFSVKSVAILGTLRASAGSLVLTLVVGLTACAEPTTPAPPGSVQIHASPQVSLLDAPVTTVVTGLTPGSAVRIQATSTDCNGKGYASQAVFTADRDGRIDLATTEPSSGSYGGSHAMGLFWSMAPTAHPSDYEFCVPNGGYDVDITVRRGATLLARETLRRAWPGTKVTMHDERPQAVGFYGEYAAPPAANGSRPGVVVFGGSDGGLYTTVEAALLAAHGFPALALAYFREPGLPPTLQRIPLEYFARAIRWLAKQPGVDSAHVIVEGTSRGSEAALLLGVRYPQLVHAVIARVTNDVVLCGITQSLQCAGPSWTMNGAPIPYTQEFDEPSPTDVPGAVIPVEMIQGPLLLSCGGVDAVWSSCAFAHAIQARLEVHGYRHAHQLAEYPDAGHGAGFNEAPSVPIHYAALGGNAEADALAITDFWSRELAFLDSLTSPP